MSHDLIRYDAACRAIAQARATDEVLKIRDQSAMLRAYARQAKNRELEITAMEIRIRAERRTGELLQQQREQIGLSKGAAGDRRPNKQRGSAADPRKVATLKDAGIDKHLADRARKLAALPRPQFEAAITDWREQQTYRAERVSADLARTAKHRSKASSQRITTTDSKELDHYSAGILVRLTHAIRALIRAWPTEVPIRRVSDHLRGEADRLERLNGGSSL